ncbi:murein hydrolase activator EnvC family protein [Carnobacterium gallinarum]|uniref:murein hydrolase activator EnvC family protein n=1 Tax=Carnobacterium gallinarum TaxID=2749 RepID=UPI0005513368|nr:M23 family metallopeptidase [Carnobacterium gallinarum]
MKKKLTVGLIATVFMIQPILLNETAKANTVDDIHTKAKAIEEKNNEVTNRINESDASLQSLEVEKATLETDVTKLQAEIDTIILKLQKQEENLTKTEERMKQLKAEIAVLEERIEQRSEKLENQARYVQTDGDVMNIANVVLTAENFSDLIGRVSAVSTLVSANKNIVVEHEKDQDSLEVAEKSTQVEKEAALTIKNEIEVAKNNLYAQKTEQDDKIVQIASKYKLTETEKNNLVAEKTVLASQASKLSSDLKAEEARITAEQQAKIAADLQAEAMNAAAAAQQAAANQNTTTSSVSDGSNSNNSGSTTEGGFVRPANGYVSSPFGYRNDPFSGAQTFHKGIDIAGGGSIVATKGGVVEYSSYNNGGYGYLVIIDHGVVNGMNYKSYYAHMAAGSLTKSPGQSVSQGEQIGIMGTTGSSTGVHLHFEIRENNNPVNPAPFIGL